MALCFRLLRSDETQDELEHGSLLERGAPTQTVGVFPIWQKIATKAGEGCYKASSRLTGISARALPNGRNHPIVIGGSAEIGFIMAKRALLLRSISTP